MTSSACAASIASPVDPGTPACRSADVILSTTPPTTSDSPMPRLCARAESPASGFGCTIDMHDLRARFTGYGHQGSAAAAGPAPPASGTLAPADVGARCSSRMAGALDPGPV